MIQRRIPFAEIWRVLAYTLAIAIALVVLGRLQLALFSAPGTQPWLQRVGLLQADPAVAMRQPTAEIAAASRAATQGLPSGHRMAALRLGYELGYASQLVGVRALSTPEARARGLRQAEPHARLAEQSAAQWGLGTAAPLGAGSLREFTELGARYEADENRPASRIEQHLSPPNRQLYLLGVQLGSEAARIDGSGGRFSLPPESLIARHAALAGIDARWWQPLAAPPMQDEAPQQVMQRYRTALEAVAAEMMRQDAADGAAAM